MSSIKPTRKKVKLGEVINMCYEILLPQFVESRVSFWRGGVEDVEIDGYPGLIEQIFINLFINSLDIMKEGGRIEVRIDEEEDLVRVEVRDTGPGIPADIKNRIFEPFFTTKKEGTGMGLTLVKHGVEMHGGKIDLESEEGVGTAFYITLPKRWEGY
jgi:signal transduction histidine kinase